MRPEVSKLCSLLVLLASLAIPGYSAADPTISIADSAQFEGNSQTPMPFVIALSAPATHVVSFRFSTADPSSSPRTPND